MKQAPIAMTTAVSILPHIAVELLEPTVTEPAAYLQVSRTESSAARSTPAVQSPSPNGAQTAAPGQSLQAGTHLPRLSLWEWVVGLAGLMLIAGLLLWLLKKVWLQRKKNGTPIGGATGADDAWVHKTAPIAQPSTEEQSHEPPLAEPALRPALSWRYQPLWREYEAAWKLNDATDFTSAALKAIRGMQIGPSEATDASRATPAAPVRPAAASAPAQATSPAVDVWRQVQSLLSGIEDMTPSEAEGRHQDAIKRVRAALAIAPLDQQAPLQANLIHLDLLQAKRKKGGSRLLALRTMQVRHADVLKQASPPVCEAWIHTLSYWASIQAGQAALRKCDEAQAYCLQLQQLAHATLTAQRLLAGVLLQRADIEEGTARERSLQRATELLQALHESQPTADNALALAKATLAHGQALPPEQARTAYGNALFLAFTAENDPHLAHAGLQCRLAIQLAYEQIPDTPTQGEVAMDLTRRLEALPVNDADTLALMARAYLRAGRYADACRVCERAWRERHTGSALLALWQQACRQWAAASPDWHDTALQASERQYKRASCMA